MKRIVLYSGIVMFVGQAYGMRIVLHKIQAQVSPKTAYRRWGYTDKLLSLSQNTIAFALKQEWVEQIKECLVNGANIEARDTKQYWTPLFWSVWYRREEIVSLLLKAGAKVNARDLQQRTPLHIAIELGNIAIANMLIGSGANMYVSDESGRTPLDFALQSKNAEFIVYFKKLHNLKMREIWLEILKQTKLACFATRIVSTAFPV